MPRGSYVDSPEIAKKLRFSTEFEALSSPESSFELPSPPGDTKTPVISINSGSTSEGVTVADVAFLKDEFFSGGGTVRTDAVVGSEEEVLLYQTARVGDFDYK